MTEESRWSSAWLAGWLAVSKEGRDDALDQALQMQPHQNTAKMGAVLAGIASDLIGKHGFEQSHYDALIEAAKTSAESEARAVEKARADWAKVYADWQYEVANGDTFLGLEDWCEHQKEQE